MTDVTRILSAIEEGDPTAGGELLPLVEACPRQVDDQKVQHWHSRAHFFAAEAMWRIRVSQSVFLHFLRIGGKNVAKRRIVL